MMRTEEKRTRPGDFFLLVVLLANLVCGVGLIGLLRADLSKDQVTAESTLASSKISAYLWGKVLRFTSAVAEGRRAGETTTPKGNEDALTNASDLPAGEGYQRIRSGTGESLPIFIGAPRDLPGRGRVLPLAVLVDGGTRQDPHYVIGAISLADVDGYLGDLRRRGILCRIVDPEGNTLFGASGELRDRRVSASRFEGGAPVMGGALSREWSLQTYVPNAGSRLPFLPQAILATFFLLNMATLVYLRQRFILPAEAALEAVSETVVAQGEILPPRAAPTHIAGAVINLLSRCRLEWEEENRSVRETTERRLREISESQKNLLSHHRLTKKMFQSRRTDEVFEILLAGVTEGYGYSGALIGKVSADGYLVFQGETDPVSGSPLRIPLWNPGSLLARTFWSGNLYHGSPRELAHLPEEESILGSFPVLCLPIMRNLVVRSEEVKSTVDRNCPDYHSEDQKCWLRQVPQEFFTGGGNPEVHR